LENQARDNETLQLGEGDVMDIIDEARLVSAIGSGIVEAEEEVADNSESVVMKPTAAQKSMPKLKPKPTDSVDGEPKTDKISTVKPKPIGTRKRMSSVSSEREAQANKAKQKDKPDLDEETLRGNSQSASSSTPRPRTSASPSPRSNSRSSDLSPTQEPRVQRNSRGRTPKSLENYSLSSKEGGSDDEETSMTKTRTLRKRGGKKSAEGKPKSSPNVEEPVKRPRRSGSRRKSGKSGGETSASERSEDESEAQSESSFSMPKAVKTPKAAPTSTTGAKKPQRKKPGPAPGFKRGGRKKAPETRKI